MYIIVQSYFFKLHTYILFIFMIIFFCDIVGRAFSIHAC